MANPLDNIRVAVTIKDILVPEGGNNKIEISLAAKMSSNDVFINVQEDCRNLEEPGKLSYYTNDIISDTLEKKEVEKEQRLPDKALQQSIELSHESSTIRDNSGIQINNAAIIEKAIANIGLGLQEKLDAFAKQLNVFQIQMESIRQNLGAVKKDYQNFKKDIVTISTANQNIESKMAQQMELLEANTKEIKLNEISLKELKADVKEIFRAIKDNYPIAVASRTKTCGEFDELPVEGDDCNLSDYCNEASEKLYYDFQVDPKTKKIVLLLKKD